MPLKPVTREFLALVQRETGYPVKLVEEPELPTRARVQIARGNVPAHLVQYRPARDDSVDYLICYQCGFVLRLFETSPAERFDLIGTEAGRAEVQRLVTRPDSGLAKYDLSSAQRTQMASAFYDGLLTHLRSIPIGLRVAEWLHENYPELREGQRATVLKEIADAKGTLQPQVRDMTPDRVYAVTQAINAAYGTYWAEQYGMRELATPFQFAGFERAGRALLKIWRDTPAEPAHDRALIESWAESLGIRDWLQWTPYVAP